MNQPEITLSLVSNVWCRQMHFINAGDVEYGHSHKFDHVSLVSSGSIRIWIEDQFSDYKAPTMVLIAKEQYHRLEALEDNTVVHCIHALRDGEAIEDIIDPKLIPKGSTLESLYTKGTVKSINHNLHVEYKEYHGL